MAFAVAAGGRIRIAGPGEDCSVILTQPAWVSIHTPVDAGRQAAASGYVPQAAVSIDLAHEGVWLCLAQPSPLPMPPGQPAQGPPPAATAADTGPATGGWLPLSEWLGRGLSALTPPVGSGPA